MACFDRHANVTWRGGLMDGTGEANAGLTGLDASQFDSVAQDAERHCPVSNAYRDSLEITLEANVG